MKDLTPTRARLMRALATAYRLFGSTTNTEIAGIVLLGVLGMLASILVFTPGDQTGDGLRALYSWLFLKH